MDFLEFLLKCLLLFGFAGLEFGGVKVELFGRESVFFFTRKIHLQECTAQGRIVASTGGILCTQKEIPPLGAKAPYYPPDA